ncbi:uncharacterized protein LOC133739690 [Rosa rugosa]|uniref:uncharacterized protein LOC133739690 n=1 Tax=Rosa rugosa TaxID=74645 RepID=UPI002B413925|nr:uncharacterized protein LOC133739690 [Rosa rugosa]
MSTGEDEMAKKLAREERRRRIAERGSDRMALITGQIQSLPPSPPVSPVLPPQQPRPPINVGTLFKDDNRRGSTLQTQEASNKVPTQTNIETKQSEGVDGSTKTQLPADTTIVSKSPTNTDQPQSQRRRTNFFSSKILNLCIVESENMRIVCSLIIALLVVLSYVDYALFGMNIVNSESVVASRPLYIILLTDVTVVMARLVYFREADEEERMVSSSQDNEGHSWAGAVKLLERGLVVYQAIRGIFIDFSVYAVVVICGLSFFIT